MLTQAKVMFLCDVDNTLLDNDRFAADRRMRLRPQWNGRRAQYDLT